MLQHCYMQSSYFLFFEFGHLFLRSLSEGSTTIFNGGRQRYCSYETSQLYICLCLSLSSISCMWSCTNNGVM